jgi:CBS domain containing-hemolysin-like protein
VDWIFRIAAVLLLVFVNAFFVAAEFSIVTVRRTRVEQLVAERHPLARSIRRAVANPAPFIATTQLGVTMASLALGWIGEPLLAGTIETGLTWLPSSIAHLTAHSIATVVAFVAITAIDIVLGELIPKSLALQQAERVSFVVIEPMLLLQAILRPFVWLLTEAGALGLRLMGLEARAHPGLVYSVEELKLLVTASRQAGVLEESEEDMIGRVFNFADLHAHDVMLPRTEMVSVPLDATVANVLELAARTHRLQFPVFESSIDNVVGIVYIVDLLPRVGRVNLPRASIRAHVRDALILPETITVDVLIERMRQQKTHIAILVDEYGGTAGLVQLGDVLERIVGPVPDQFEEPPPEIQHCQDGTLLVDGLARLEDVNEEAAMRLESDVYDTIGGFVLGEIGRRPRVGDKVTAEGSTFQVEAVDGLRIARIRIWPASSASKEPSGVEATD